MVFVDYFFYRTACYLPEINTNKIVPESIFGQNGKAERRHYFVISFQALSVPILRGVSGIKSCSPYRDAQSRPIFTQGWQSSEIFACAEG